MQLWSLCTSEGAGVYFEPYCGSHTQIHDAGLGQGPNVVLDLLGKANLAPGSEVFFDNLFTSFPLLEKLSGVYSTLLVSHRSRKSLINNLFFNISELGIAGTGTVRQNRLNKIPIIDKKEMEKKTVERGTMEAIFKDDQVLYLSIEFCFCILIFLFLSGPLRLEGQQGRVRGIEQVQRGGLCQSPPVLQEAEKRAAGKYMFKD